MDLSGCIAARAARSGRKFLTGLISLTLALDTGE